MVLRIIGIKRCNRNDQITFNLFVSTKGITKSIFLPGHEWVLQSWLSRASPGQDFPPKLGAGRVQLLERPLKPVPQDLLQEVHSVQSDHPPSTEKHKNKTKKEREKKKEKNPQCYYLQTAKWGLLTRKERTVNKQIY